MLILCSQHLQSAIHLQSFTFSRFNLLGSRPVKLFESSLRYSNAEALPIQLGIVPNKKLPFKAYNLFNNKLDHDTTIMLESNLQSVDNFDMSACIEGMVPVSRLYST